MRSGLSLLRIIATQLVVLFLVLAGMAPPGAFGQPTAGEAYTLSPPWLPLLGKTPVPPEGEPGAWFPWSAAYYQGARGIVRDMGLSAAEVKVWDDQLQAVVGVLAQIPVLRDRLGFSPEPTGHISGFWDGPGSESGRKPVVGGFMIGTWIPEQIVQQADGGRKIDGETRYLIFRLNEIPLGHGENWMEDEAGKFFPLPAIPSPFPGTQLAGYSLLVTGPGKPPAYIPVSQERVLRALIATSKEAEQVIESTLAGARFNLEYYLSPENEPARQAEIEQTMKGYIEMNRMEPEAARKRAEAIDERYIEQLREAASPSADSPLYEAVQRAQQFREQLEAMSEEQRRAPAWVSADGGSLYEGFELRAPGSPGSAPVMQINPEFFDPTLPNTAFQSIGIGGIHEYADLGHGERVNQWTIVNRVNLLILQQTDWVALAAGGLK